MRHSLWLPAWMLTSSPPMTWKGGDDRTKEIRRYRCLLIISLSFTVTHNVESSTVAYDVIELSRYQQCCCRWCSHTLPFAKPCFLYMWFQDSHSRQLPSECESCNTDFRLFCCAQRFLKLVVSHTVTGLLRVLTALVLLIRRSPGTADASTRHTSTVWCGQDVLCQVCSPALCCSGIQACAQACDCHLFNTNCSY